MSMYISCIHGTHPGGEMRNSPRQGLEFRLNYHLQLETRKGMGKATVQDDQGKFGQSEFYYADLSHGFPTDKSLRFTHPSPSRYRREKPSQMQISFINVTFPYKRVTSLFSELLLCLLFLKIINSK